MTGWQLEKVSLFRKEFSFPLRYRPADIGSIIAGIDPLHDIAVLQLIAAASVVGEPVVDAVHPAGQLAHIEFIEVVDAFDIGRIIHRRILELHMDLLLLAGALEYVEDALSLIEGDGHRLQDPPVLRYQLFFFRIAEIQIIQNGCAGDGNGAAVCCLSLIHI